MYSTVATPCVCTYVLCCTACCDISGGVVLRCVEMMWCAACCFIGCVLLVLLDVMWWDVLCLGVSGRVVLYCAVL